MRARKLATLRVTPAWGLYADGLRRQLAVNERGDDETAMLTESLVYKAGQVTSYEYQRGVLRTCSHYRFAVPDFPGTWFRRVLLLKTCLESHHKALTAKIKAQEEECGGQASGRDEGSAGIGPTTRRCRADLAGQNTGARREGAHAADH